MKKGLFVACVCVWSVRPNNFRGVCMCVTGVVLAFQRKDGELSLSRKNDKQTKNIL